MKTNYFRQGENLTLMRELPNHSIALAYLDPPFFCQRDFQDEQGEFSDKWKSKEDYLAFMQERIQECHRLLKQSGAIFLHCDWRASHHLRILLDQAFGERNFRNEIIWAYTGMNACKHHFKRKHDTIFYYSKSARHVFNADAVRIPYQPSFLAKATGSSGAFGVKHNHERIKELFEIGKVIEDWWTDIPIQTHPTLARKYPTEKPIKLLERIILAASQTNDTILDPFCGSGTSLVAAARHGRQWIGFDRNPNHALIEDRMDKERTLFQSNGKPTSQPILPSQPSLAFHR